MPCSRTAADATFGISIGVAASTAVGALRDILRPEGHSSRRERVNEVSGNPLNLRVDRLDALFQETAFIPARPYLDPGEWYEPWRDAKGYARLAEQSLELLTDAGELDPGEQRCAIGRLSGSSM